MRSPLRLSARYLVLFTAMVSTGCGKGYELAPVSGRVEMNGHPLAHALVTFGPIADPNLPSSSGYTDEEGKFTMTVNDSSKSPGAVIGENHVSISLNSRNLDKKAAVVHLRKPELLPARYNTASELKFTVPAGGTTEANFLDLKSK